MRVALYTTSNRLKAMPISRLGQRRQVVIPKDICEKIGLREGDFLEVARVRNTVIIRPKKIVDAEDTLTPEEEAIVREGEAQIRRGEYVTLEQLEHDMERNTREKRRKAI